LIKKYVREVLAFKVCDIGWIIFSLLGPTVQIKDALSAKNAAGSTIKTMIGSTLWGPLRPHNPLDDTKLYDDHEASRVSRP
jgi:hypothetical protein